MEKLKNSPVKVTARAGANGKLFGAVTSKEVSDALQAQHGIELAKQKIVMDEPIKAYGSYELKYESEECTVRPCAPCTAVSL